MLGVYLGSPFLESIHTESALCNCCEHVEVDPLALNACIFPWSVLKYRNEIQQNFHLHELTLIASPSQVQLITFACEPVLFVSAGPVVVTRNPLAFVHTCRKVPKYVNNS